jgi:hypothetical protein
MQGGRRARFCFRKVIGQPTCVIASEAKQSKAILDCFVAEPVIGPAEGRTRWLLAMTASSPKVEG